MEKAENPGEVSHLPFNWPEESRFTKWQPPEISPIVKLFLKTGRLKFPMHCLKGVSTPMGVIL